MADQTYIERRPPRALRGKVSVLWTQDVDVGAAPHTQRNVADGSAEILCRIGEPPRIVGPRTDPTVELLPPGTVVVGARVKPQATGSLLGVPAGELVDRTVTFDDLPGFAVRQVGRRLAEAPTAARALRLLEGILEMRSEVAGPVDPVAAETVGRLEARDRGGLRAIREDLFLSERHFRRRVGDAVGVAPKVLDRMLRFQRLMGELQARLARGETLAGEAPALAASQGYADESHLNRECRRLTGLSIGGFLAEADHTCGCGHDHGVSIGNSGPS